MALHKNLKLVPLLLLAGLSACQQAQAPNGAETHAGQAPTAASSAPTAAAAPASAKKIAIADMDADQLRQAAITAMSENRLYSPGGDNAIEYYLALRGKLPDDPNVAGALIDLAPYTAIAIGQSLSRNEFDEADRLTGLIAKIDPSYPALPRLHQNIADARDALQKRQTADEQNRLAAQQRAAEQQQQKAQQKAPAQTAAPRALEEPALQRPLASAPTQAVQQQAAAPTQAAQQQAAAPAASELRVISAPPPRFPTDAFRNGISGEVLLEMTVGVDGSVTEARVVRATPARIFDHEALAAVKRWKFAPVIAPVTTRKTINFKAD